MNFDVIKENTRYLSQQDVKDYTSPCVYIWIKNDEVTYVGVSKYGISRALSPHNNHKQINGCCFQNLLDKPDECLIFLFPNYEDAFKSERELITLLKPSLNREGVTRKFRKYDQVM